MATARRSWDPWKWIRQNPSIFLYDLVVNERFLDLLYRKQVLKSEEKKWLMSTFLTGSDDDHCSRLKMVLLYTMLTRHTDVYKLRTYTAFHYALAKTGQLGILGKITLENPPPDLDGHQQEEEFTESSHSEGDPFTFDFPDEPQYIVDIIMDEAMCIEIQKAQESIRTWLGTKLASVDIEIRPHVAHFPSPETGQRRLTIIFPNLDLEESDQGSINSLLIERLISDGGVSNCKVELIPVRGLDHLFEIDSECSLRDEFADDATSPTSRDTGTFMIFNEEDFMYDKEEDHLGSGMFSNVFKVNIPGINRQAALKVSDIQVSEQSFGREYRAFQEIDHHDNVIQLLGICVVGKKHSLVLEYAENGDLEALLTHHLRDHPDVEKDHKWMLRTNMALDVAQGMAILHKKIIHLDLKTSNVLVGQGYCCKISDFGSSEFLNESENSQFSQREPGSINTVAFTAPERFGGTSHWTWKKQKADVYAYAMILLQLKQLEKPWQGETSADVIKTNVLARIRPSLKPDGCPDYVVNLIKQCWTHNPEKRPDFSGIVNQLKLLSPKSPDSGGKTIATRSSKRFPARSLSRTDSLPTGVTSSRGSSPCTDGSFSRQRASTSSPHVVGALSTLDVVQYHTRPGSAGTPLGHCGSLPAKAKAKVPDKELKDVAKEIAGCWLDLATELDPSLFQVKKKLLEIQGDHRYPSQTAKAQCMLETWRGHYGENATCTRLVNALCRTDIRSVATEVFGQELVNFICLQSQSQ